VPAEGLHFRTLNRSKSSRQIVKTLRHDECERLAEN
jgi:5,10-methylenetetrahydrofolate reductase